MAHWWAHMPKKLLKISYFQVEMSWLDPPLCQCATLNGIYVLEAFKLCGQLIISLAKSCLRHSNCSRPECCWVCTAKAKCTRHASCISGLLWENRAQPEFIKWAKIFIQLFFDVKVLLWPIDEHTCQRNCSKIFIYQVEISWLDPPLCQCATLNGVYVLESFKLCGRLIIPLSH